MKVSRSVFLFADYKSDAQNEILSDASPSLALISPGGVERWLR